MLSNMDCSWVQAELRKDADIATITITRGSCLSVGSNGTMFSGSYRLLTCGAVCQLNRALFWREGFITANWQAVWLG